jgi:hypothetical protein
MIDAQRGLFFCQQCARLALISQWDKYCDGIFFWNTEYEQA